MPYEVLSSLQFQIEILFLIELRKWIEPVLVVCCRRKSIAGWRRTHAEKIWWGGKNSLNGVRLYISSLLRISYPRIFLVIAFAIYRLYLLFFWGWGGIRKRWPVIKIVKNLLLLMSQVVLVIIIIIILLFCFDWQIRARWAIKRIVAFVDLVYAKISRCCIDDNCWMTQVITII